jgi:hypothetical protein
MSPSHRQSRPPAATPIAPWIVIARDSECMGGGQPNRSRRTRLGHAFDTRHLNGLTARGSNWQRTPESWGRNSRPPRSPGRHDRTRNCPSKRHKLRPERNERRADTARSPIRRRRSAEHRTRHRIRSLRRIRHRPRDVRHTRARKAGNPPPRHSWEGSGVRSDHTRSLRHSPARPGSLRNGAARCRSTCPTNWRSRRP